MSEDMSSDVDILLTSSKSNKQHDYFNFSEMENFSLLNKFIDSSFVDSQLSQLQEDFAGVAPRWYLEAQAYYQNASDYVNIILILANQTQEINIGLGKNFQNQKVLNESEAFISQSALNLLGYNKFKDLLYAFLVQDNPQGLSLKFKEVYMNLKNDNSLSREDFTLNLQLELTNLFKKQLGYPENINLKKLILQLSSYLFENETVQVLQHKLQRKHQKSIHHNFKILNKQKQKHKVQLLLSENVNISKLIEQMIPVLIDICLVQQKVRVVDSVQSPNGKWSQGLGSVILMDLEFFMNVTIEIIVEQLWSNQNQVVKILQDSLLNNNTNYSNQITLAFLAKNKQKFTDGLKQFLQSWNIDQYAMVSNVVVQDKPFLYNYEYQLKSKLIRHTNSIMNSLGKNFEVKLEAPISDSYLELSNFSVFFDNLSGIVICLLTYISGVVIFALMTFKVDEKTYVFGMLRVLGLPVQDVVLSLFMESFIFSVIGSFLGIALAFILSIIVKYILYKFSAEYDDYLLNPFAIALGLFIGLFVPFVANILPAKKALGTKLLNALDLTKRNVTDVDQLFEDISKTGLDFTEVIVSVYMVAIGFTSFYVVCYFFIFSNYRLLSYVLVAILMILLAGLVIMIGFLTTSLNSFAVQLLGFLACQSKGIISLAQKNIRVNSQKNFRIGILFNLSIIFLFLSASGFGSISYSLKNTIKQSIGSDIVVYATNQEGLKEKEISKFLEKFIKFNPNLIRDFSFATPEIGQIDNSPGNLEFTPLSNYPLKSSSLVGLQSNFFNCVYTETYVETSYFPGLNESYLFNERRRDGLNDLYQFDMLNLSINETNLFQADSNYQQRIDEEKKMQLKSGTKILSMLFMEGYSNELGLDINSSVLINNQDKRLLSKVVHIAKKIPGYLTSSTKLLSSIHTGMTTMENFAYLLAVYSKKWRQKFNVTDINDESQFKKKEIADALPKGRLFIKFQNELMPSQRSILLNNLKQFIHQDSSQIFDTSEILASTDTAVFILNIFFFSVAIISLTLTFFVLLVTLIRNIKENQREIGELRSIGLTKTDILRISMLEQMSVLIVAAFLGIIIGNSISFLIINVFSMFNEMNYTGDIPWTFCILTVLIAFLISWITARAVVTRIVDRPIAEIFRTD